MTKRWQAPSVAGMFRWTSGFDRWRVFPRAFRYQRCPSVSLWRRCSFGSRQIKRIYHHLQTGVSCVTCRNVVFSPEESERSKADERVRRASLFFLARYLQSPLVNKCLRVPVTSDESHDRKRRALWRMMRTAGVTPAHMFCRCAGRQSDALFDSRIMVYWISTPPCIILSDLGKLKSTLLLHPRLGHFIWC